jgi:hypothetical protein
MSPVLSIMVHLSGRGTVMKEEMFKELLESVRQACAIMRGEMEPSRVFVFEAPDVKAINAQQNGR